jgi:hypothetical protein
MLGTICAWQHHDDTLSVAVCIAVEGRILGTPLAQVTEFRTFSATESRVLEHLALNLHHPSLRAKRGNPDSGAAGLPRFARNDDAHLLHCALKPILSRSEACWNAFGYRGSQARSNSLPRAAAGILEPIWIDIFP